ncbi:MAG: DUF3829 domain-containing protein [Labilithrix sp.]|nr:DUF3829 domain-containing protein [Labilithrix sp.]
MGICLALTTISCNKLFKKKSDAGAGSTTSNATAQDLSDEQMSIKLDAYIKCINTVGHQISRSTDRYFDTLPLPGGPTGKETFAAIFRVPPGVTANCASGISRASTLPPDDPKLEIAGTEYASAAQALDVIINQLATYFDTKGFKNDKWARGKALHPQFISALKRFNTADRGMHEAVDGITKPLAQRALARIEREDGRKFRYGRRKVLITARDLIESADPVGDDRDVDFNLFNQTYTDFEKALDELSAYGASHRADLSNPALTTTPLADSNFTAFTREATDFKKVSNLWWQCLRGAPASSKTASGKIDKAKIGRCADGSNPIDRKDKTVKEYNDFINTSNGQPFP